MKFIRVIKSRWDEQGDPKGYADAVTDLLYNGDSKLRRIVYRNNAAINELYGCLEDKDYYEKYINSRVLKLIRPLIDKFFDDVKYYSIIKTSSAQDLMEDIGEFIDSYPDAIEINSGLDFARYIQDILSEVRSTSEEIIKILNDIPDYGEKFKKQSIILEFKKYYDNLIKILEKMNYILMQEYNKNTK